MEINKGETYRVECKFYDVSGSGFDPSTIKMELTNTSGTTAWTAGTAVLTKVATGHYRWESALGYTGLHEFVWEGSASTVVIVERGQFQVKPGLVS